MIALVRMRSSPGKGGGGRVELDRGAKITLSSLAASV
jgi:hypothetical protein